MASRQNRRRRRGSKDCTKRTSSKSREEIDEASEAVAAERKVAHVGPRDRHRSVFSATRAQEDPRKIATDRRVTKRLQLGHVPSHSAGEVEHAAVDRAELRTKERHLLPRLVLIAIRVELEVLLAEPFLVPRHLKAESRKQKAER